MNNILEVKHLSIEFATGGHGNAEVIKDVSFNVASGEIMALVGESGCGKSLSCLALTRLIPSPPGIYRAGEIDFVYRQKSYNMLNLPEKELRKLRGGGIGYIFQEPSSSLNPVFRVGDQIAEAIYLHRPKVTDVKKEIIDLLTQVGIPAPESRLNAYPHELSGGMQQRIMIAMALAARPALLVADEPTTALDVTIQAQILELLDSLRQTTNMAIILVTHNLGIVAELADHVTVMYAGNVVEQAVTKDLFIQPSHPYTKSLLQAVPKLNNPVEKLATIPGSVPSPDKLPKGCRFFGRCSLCSGLPPEQQQVCKTQVPELHEVAPEHFCRCHFVVERREVPCP